MERAFGVFDLCMAVEAAGYRYTCAAELPLNRDELIPDNACVVVNGPAARVAELCRTRRWIPGAWCEPDVFACRTYYHHWSRHIVQEQFALLPLGSLLAERSDLIRTIADKGKVFIRPDSFDKSFDGGLVELADLEAWLARTRSTEAPDSTLCVVSRPRAIENEWRLIVQDRRVIAGSSYRIGGRVIKTQAPPVSVVRFAESVASDPYPRLPNLYVMDIASAEGKLAVVEVGSVNACGFYGCDLRTVIKAISEEAEKTWHACRGNA